MRLTGFRPSIHGFHFSNNNIRWSWGLLNNTALCGGMSFASLDYFYYRMPIPGTFLPPEEGGPLHNYIMRRQMHAHRFAIPRLITGESQYRNEPFESCVRADRKFGIVKRMIDSGRPVPILLSAVGASVSTNSHWVVAIGYSSSPGSSYGCEMAMSLKLYDNNQPNVESELVIDWISQVFKISGSRREYAIYIPFESYTSIRPTREAMSVPHAATEQVNPFNLRN